MIDQLTPQQKLWLDDFIEQLNNQEDIDHFIYTNIKKLKGGAI